MSDELREALKRLLDACLLADAHEELSGYVDGSLLDAAKAALAAFSPAGAAPIVACPGVPMYLTNIRCPKCGSGSFTGTWHINDPNKQGITDCKCSSCGEMFNPEPMAPTPAENRELRELLNEMLSLLTSDIRVPCLQCGAERKLHGAITEPTIRGLKRRIESALRSAPLPGDKGCCLACGGTGLAGGARPIDSEVLADAIAFAERIGPLPRCSHGKALKDGAGELLEPSCGCRWAPGAWPKQLSEVERATGFSTDLGRIAAGAEPRQAGKK